MSNYQQYGPPQGPPRQQQPLPPAFPQHQYGQQYGAPPQSGYGWGPQFGPPGMPPGPGGWHQPPRPPKRRNTGLLVSLGILGVLGVVALVTVIGVALNNKGGGDDPATSQPNWTPTATPTPPPEPTYYPTSTKSTEQPPTTRPTITRPTPTRPTTRPTTAPPNDRQIVTKDGFYYVGLLPGANCRESKGRQTAIGPASVYIGTIKKCLDRAWAAPVRRGRDTFRAPSLVVMNGVTGTTPCGGGSAFRSFYCPTNQTIYMDALTGIRQYNKASQYTNASQVRMFVRMATSQTMAHEYGHHLQEISGILQAYYNLRYEQDSYDSRLELNRRMELQASCIGGVFMGANRNTYPVTGAARTEWNWLVIHSGDEYDTERTHGSRIVHSYWSQRGFNSRNTNFCNTFIAGPSLVR